MNLLRASFVLVILGAAATTGCYAGVDAEPVAYAEAEPMPADITVYPHTEYEGRTVYYYRDRWYYNDAGRWAYYRSEPAPLYRHRTYVQAAPPAPRVYTAQPVYTTQPVYSAPQTTSGTVEAPPAVRVR